MADSCSSCFFGQRFQNVPDASSGKSVGVRVCACTSPGAINLASGPVPILFAPVTDDHWCGEGKDHVTGRPFAAAVQDVYLVAALPSSQPGLRLFVSDSRNTNFGTVVNGGGNNFVPVYGDNAGHWVIG